MLHLLVKSKRQKIMNRTILLLSLLFISHIPSLPFKTHNNYIQCIVDDRNMRAIEYVSTRPTGGIVQLQLLQREGLQKNHYVLEVGYGALSSGIPIMSSRKRSLCWY